MEAEKLKCPKCGAEMSFKKETGTMFCPQCGYEVGAKFNKNFDIVNKDVKSRNLLMGKKFELGSFI